MKKALLASVADQGVSALTNIVVVVLVARMSSAAGFAAFAIAYLVFSVLLGACGAYVGQALVLQAERRATACRSALAVTALAATVTGAVLALVCVWLPGGVAASLAALGLVLPVVLLQDSVRYCCSTLHLPHRALAADLLRLVVVVPALALQPAGSSPAWLILVWGLSAVPALLAGLALLASRLRGAGTDLRSYLRRRHLGRRFVVEFGVGNASSQLSVLALGGIASPLVVGALRGSTTLFGPLNVLYNAATVFGPPLLLDRDGRAVVRATAVGGLTLAVLAAGWTAVLAVLPANAGRQVLGDTWAAAAAVVPAIGAQYTAMALGVAGLLTLRVLRPRATLPIQVTLSLLAVVLLFTGYALGGVGGAAWGLAAGSAAKAVVVWLRVAFIRRHTPPSPVLSPVAAGGGS